MICAHRFGIEVADFHRENAVTMRIGDQRQQPDATLRLLPPTGIAFNLLYEIDNSTEPINSDRDRESIRRKIHFHERYQN